MTARTWACDYYDGDLDAVCTATTDARYMVGPRCPEHTPARLAGRLEPSPDPTRAAEALRSRPLHVTPEVTPNVT